MYNKEGKLIFVYNADSSVFAIMSGAVRKAVAPDTYRCNLCMVTHGTMSMKKEWREFLNALPYNKEFLHRDEFFVKYSDLLNKIDLPAILLERKGSVRLLLSAKEINDEKDVRGLSSLISRKLRVL